MRLGMFVSLIKGLAESQFGWEGVTCDNFSFEAKTKSIVIKKYVKGSPGLAPPQLP
jgi:hypothetical protein